jgi:hypothetical protein
VQFDGAALLDLPPERLLHAPEPALRFVSLPPLAFEKKRYAAWGKEAVACAVERAALTRFKSPSTKLESTPGESERDFRARVVLAARETRDSKVAALQAKYDTKLHTLREREQKLAAQRAREDREASAAKLEGMVSVGSAIFGAFFGKSGVSKTDIQRAGKAVRSASRVGKESADVGRVEEQLAEATAAREALEAELTSAVATLSAPPVDEVFESKLVKPKKADVELAFIGLAFVPEVDPAS